MKQPQPVRLLFGAALAAALSLSILACSDDDGNDDDIDNPVDGVDDQLDDAVTDVEDDIDSETDEGGQD